MPVGQNPFSNIIQHPASDRGATQLPPPAAGTMPQAPQPSVTTGQTADQLIGSITDGGQFPPDVAQAADVQALQRQEQAGYPGSLATS